jgi:predicted 3-demethylubiquinone-9 3-methyltransferase (glyoxalase superfamily)
MEAAMVATGFTTSLWFDGQAEEAADFYLTVFDGEKGRISRYTQESPGEPGSVMAVEWTMNGQRFVGINGGPQFHFDEAVSFQIHCDDQEEIDHYWSTLTAGGGHEVECGWLRDRFGLSWQVVPKVLADMISDPDQEKAARATAAMMKMKKLDIAELRRAYEGG